MIDPEDAESEIPADFDASCLPDESQCTCSCHHTPHVQHVVACCTGLPIDFWDREYDPFFIGRVSSKPSRRNSSYEEVDEWMCYINASDTGKPLAGPGSERVV